MQAADVNVRQVSYSTVIIAKLCKHAFFLQITSTLTLPYSFLDYPWIMLDAFWELRSQQTAQPSSLPVWLYCRLTFDDLKSKLNIDQLREVLQLSSVKNLGGEHQLRLVASWMDSEVATAAQLTPVDQLDSLLPFMDLQSITDDALFYFMGENHVIIANQQCR